MGLEIMGLEIMGLEIIGWMLTAFLVMRVTVYAASDPKAPNALVH
jgi:hypothetical protein